MTATRDVAALFRARGPVARWLDSWVGVDIRGEAALPEAAQHALAMARAINGVE